MKAAEDESTTEGQSIERGTVEYFYRNELGFSKKIKSNENKFIQDTRKNDNTCCVCWKENCCNQICINCPRRCHNCGNLNIQTIGNYEIDKLIHMSQFDENAKEWEIWRWIDYKLFVFYNSNQVALKKLKNSQQIVSEFLIQVLVNFYCRDRGLKITHSHSKGFIHRDLHPGNLMIIEVHDNLKFIRLGDLGLCRPVDLILSSETYGKIPFEEDLYDPELAIAILNGHPQCYVELMKKCWHNNPSERPKNLLKFSNADQESLDYFEDALRFLNADQEMQNEDSESLCNEITWSLTHLISKPLMQA
ncbi:hypothetical protein Glove_1033g30 [Diversispora epigaea]|uniref:Protein kinase domain-containing protein n=1 Tax=Diversispora epigaea TaxID=1348612 RepID=A0A397FXX2_9GLOM|nr:hypothetical protein Glove_1033g30 [Diversispora epigaea]